MDPSATLHVKGLSPPVAGGTVRMDYFARAVAAAGLPPLPALAPGDVAEGELGVALTLLAQRDAALEHLSQQLRERDEEVALLRDALIHQTQQLASISSAASSVVSPPPAPRVDPQFDSEVSVI